MRLLKVFNWLLQPLSQDYNVAYHTTHGLGINFMHEWRDLQFKSDSAEWQIILKSFFMAILFTLRVHKPESQKTADSKSPKEILLLSKILFEIWTKGWITGFHLVIALSTRQQRLQYHLQAVLNS